MLKLRQISDLDQLGQLAFDPPPALRDAAEDAASRGEPWWALQALPEGAPEPSWLLVFPDREQDLFVLEGEALPGRWDEAQQVFIPEEGLPVDLQGRRIPLSELESEQEEDAA
ncbi:MAG TPA: hypothetical protein VFM16_08545 [Holophagaceae bacterium]|nr:hypothetical protein [Holophagaceae bacterium]